LRPFRNRLVRVAVVRATDTQTGVATFDVTGVSNERANPHKPDIVITGTGVEPRVVYLRAERSDEHDLIYTLTATATDRAGNKATTTATVTVPHRERDRDRDE
jgi:hypothetical protein